MTDFGAGPVLDENFDFEIDRTGDISTDSGLSELQKDLAVKVAEKVDEVGIGQLFDRGTVEDLRIDLGTVIQNESRIADLTRIKIAQNDDDDYQIDITIVTDAGDGPFDLVLPLPT